MQSNQDTNIFHIKNQTVLQFELQVSALRNKAKHTKKNNFPHFSNQSYA